jgi:nicotinamide-nucleotide amidase
LRVQEENHMELEELIKTLRKEELTIAFAESVTAGMAVNLFSKQLDIGPMLLGGVVAYKESCKTAVLGVKPATLEKYTGESSQVTVEMAKGLQKLMKPGVAVAVTGLATPGGSETKKKPVGSIFISVIFKGGVHEFSSRFYGTADEIIMQAVRMMYSKTTEVLNESA